MTFPIFQSKGRGGRLTAPCESHIIPDPRARYKVREHFSVNRKYLFVNVSLMSFCLIIFNNKIIFVNMMDRSDQKFIEFCSIQYFCLVYMLLVYMSLIIGCQYKTGNRLIVQTKKWQFFLGLEKTFQPMLRGLKLMLPLQINYV